MPSFMKARTLVNPSRRKNGSSGIARLLRKSKGGKLDAKIKYKMASSRKRLKKNPMAKKKRKLSPLQKLFFGSKRQRAAVSNRGKRKNPNRKIKRSYASSGNSPKTRYYAKRAVTRRRKHRVSTGKLANPSRIMTISLPSLSNPGRKRKVKRNIQNMTRRKKSSTKRRYTRRRKHVANPVRHYRRRRNPGFYRKHSRRVYHRRKRSRNPGTRSGSVVGTIGGMIGGAALTAFVSNMLPASLTNGFIGYITTAIVATLQGKVVGGVLRKPALGKNLTYGGFFYLGIKVIGDLFPSVGNYLPFSSKSMGIIGPSSFYVPQVNQASSMTSFIAPAALPAGVPVSAGMKGIVSDNMPLPGRRSGRLT